MELIKPGTSFDFVGSRTPAMVISAVLIAISIGSLIYHGGPNYGIDFTGGSMVEVGFEQTPAVDDIRSALGDLGMADATIQDFTDQFGNVGAGAGADFLIRLPMGEEDLGDASRRLTEALRGKFGEDAFEIRRIEIVGPRVGETLRNQAVGAVLAATIMMLLYIWFRFELRFGLGAYGALVHDVIVTIGALSLFNYEIDLTVVAALLTVVGFSVNDTVIISDRIRENMRKNRKGALAQIINDSVNQTLSRTIITTGTGLMVILALFFLGGNVIHSFAFTLFIGFFVGTYSSIFIASPIVLWFEGETAKGKKA